MKPSGSGVRRGKREKQPRTAKNGNRQRRLPILLYGRCSDNGAGDEARTRYLDLGKVALYQMSYTRGTVVL